MAQEPQPAPADANVYFISPQDGETVSETFTVRFGLRGMGIAPAGMASEFTGHHHILVDTDLPPLDQPIPNDAQHLHFGGGTTETELTLAPGEHTLQLLFADHDHLPHDPPVFSQPITVTVEGEREVAAAAPAAAEPAAPAPEPDPAAQPPSRTPAPPDARVYFVYPKDGYVIYPTSTIRFGLSGMGVAPAGVEHEFTGHHHLLINNEDVLDLSAPIPNDDNHLHFGAGQTQVRITLPPGYHTLQLVLADHNHVPHDPPVASERITVLSRPGGP